MKGIISLSRSPRRCPTPSALRSLRPGGHTLRRPPPDTASNTTTPPSRLSLPSLARAPAATSPPSSSRTFATRRGHPRGCHGRQGSLSPRPPLPMRQRRQSFNLRSPSPRFSSRLVTQPISSLGGGAVSRSLLTLLSIKLSLLSRESRLRRITSASTNGRQTMLFPFLTFDLGRRSIMTIKLVTVSLTALTHLEWVL